MENAFQRYKPLFFPRHSEPVKGDQIFVVSVQVKQPDAELWLETDESYEIDIPTGGPELIIKAVTQFGVMHAFETLSQLIEFDFATKAYYIHNTPWLIKDKPRFKHREVLMDSARHYLPMRTIKEFIDTLPYAKINVLHWHMVDAQSFPFDAPSRPLLVKGAYSTGVSFCCCVGIGFFK